MTVDQGDVSDVTRGSRTLIIVPALPGGHIEGRETASRVEEAYGLAQAIGLNVVVHLHPTVRRVMPATLFGRGQVATIADAISDNDVALAVVDSTLSAVQQKNLEKAWSCKVIDRTALILEIFGERAATAEGRLQVELAHLDYQAGRLVRSWTHLERQRGGFGFLGGPGETQIEADRRMIRDRMASIRRQLEEVRKTRTLQRQRRKRTPWPVVALVGYTNAGKSTLFNFLTTSSVLAEDMLFATLDPTMRHIQVPGIGKVIMSDTVGFVSDLPTQLVAAFRATLEEVEEADLLLHVRDISHEESEHQREGVLAVLSELGVGEGQGPPIIEIHNKIDRLQNDQRAELSLRAEREGSVAISALTGEGIDNLSQRLMSALGGDAVERTILVPATDGEHLAWLYRHCRILAQSSVGSDVQLNLTMNTIEHARYVQWVHQRGM